MTLDFLTVGATDGTAIARSAMEHLARRAGAQFEVRDGWNVAVRVPSGASDTVNWSDVSHLRKQELQGTSDELNSVAGTELPYNEAVRRDGAWWCRLTDTRALVIGGGEEIAGTLDVTSNFAALTVTGPLARETFARFCALDLRPQVTPAGALRPGSIARQPGILIHETQDRYLILFGSAVAEYMWETIADAAGQLDGRPIGVDQLEPFDA